MNEQTLLIPAYNPDEKLLALLPKLKERFGRIVLVNDGSTSGLDIFEKAKPFVEKILVHPVNRGKGAAIKTGLDYIGPDSDVITVDADGQHTPVDVARIAKGLLFHRGGLVLGVRDFSGKVPFRSLFGNFWTRWFFFLMTGLMIRDTQTGLRGIPASLVGRVARIPGDRYEYEMAMLADAKYHDEKPLQIPITTVYIEGNATSHFNPLLDTIRIYRRLLQYCLSSILAFLVDNIVFAVTIAYLAAKTDLREYDWIPFVAARFVSANFNYFYNRFVVFQHGKRPQRKGHFSYVRFAALVAVVLSLSFAFTEGLSLLCGVHGAWMTLIKICVDTALFFGSYYMQKEFVFKSQQENVNELTRAKAQ